MYINAVVESAMLLLHDFDNIIFEMKQIIYSLVVRTPPKWKIMGEHLLADKVA